MGELVLGWMDLIFNVWTGVAIVALVVLRATIKSVPHNTTLVVERFGKYHKTMTAGLNFLVPFTDRVAYERTLKEQAIDVPGQSAITQDNIALTVDGVLYLKVIDPYKACYGVEDYRFAVSQLAQTTMRSEIGKIELDKTFEERETLNAAIVSSINEAAAPWGIQVMRYEIKDIDPPRSVLEAMERQMKAEREKRAAILESEGQRQSQVNIAEGEKQAVVLAAQADKEQQILRAEGQAQAITAVAKAKAEAIRLVGESANNEAGQRAIQYELAGEAIGAKRDIAKESTVVLMPDQQTEAASMVAGVMAIADTLRRKLSGASAAP
jgi:regulator of protease activity HflC (stomatin/prohibitin superfamily)